ncbi:MAG TPA: TauD/TfdA family dioxygenase [Stellaceae bacterium]|nr:TauD/TfdA family dioxygenase [Stellaceae bacterium]
MKQSFFADHSLPCILEPETPARATPAALADWIETERMELRRRLDRHGAVLFRGFGLSGPGDFLHLAQTITVTPLMPYSGGDAPRGRVHDLIYNSTDAPPEVEILAHNEKSYSAAYPRTIMFYCDRARMAGGATPLADGRRILARLAPATAEAFRARGVTYIQNLHGGEGPGKSWFVTYESQDRAAVEAYLRKIGARFHWKDDGSLHVEETLKAVVHHPETKDEVLFTQAYYWHHSMYDAETRTAMLANAREDDLYHHARFGDGTAIGDDMLAELRATIRAETVEFPWQVGDLLVVDNILALHGRAPYQGERRILVAMG